MKGKAGNGGWGMKGCEGGRGREGWGGRGREVVIFKALFV